MQLMRLSALKLQINQLRNPKAYHTTVTVLWHYISLRIWCFQLTDFQEGRRMTMDLAFKCKLLARPHSRFGQVSFSALLVETACKVTHGIFYQFVNKWTHWVLIRRTAVPSLLALYQLHLSLSICSLFLCRSIYFRESILNENKQSIPHPQFPKH